MAGLYPLTPTAEVADAERWRRRGSPPATPAGTRTTTLTGLSSCNRSTDPSGKELGDPACPPTHPERPLPPAPLATGQLRPLHRRGATTGSPTPWPTRAAPRSSCAPHAADAILGELSENAANGVRELAERTAARSAGGQLRTGTAGRGPAGSRGRGGPGTRPCSGDLPVPVQDAGHPVLQVGHIAAHDLPRLLREPEVLVQDGEFVGDDMLELLHALGHQVVDDAERGRVVAAEEVLHDEDRVVDLALVLDLLLVREDVVEEAGVVDGRVLQRAGRARCGTPPAARPGRGPAGTGSS